jgi:hypothetical protein|tara:strand:+ start:411 stop:530 length:120 start_codon:yes stop_codon:yes gene_type:complete
MQSEEMLLTAAKAITFFTLGLYIFTIAVFFVPPGGVLAS